MLIDLKPEQVDYLRRLLNKEGLRDVDGDLDMLRTLDDPPLVTAYVAEIDGFDGLYLFEREEDRDAFVKAKNIVRVEGKIAEGDSPINTAATAARLISAELRENVADKLIEIGWPNVAEDVREGLPADVILKRLREIGEGDSEAAEIIAVAGLDD